MYSKLIDNISFFKTFCLDQKAKKHKWSEAREVKNKKLFTKDNHKKVADIDKGGASKPLNLEGKGSKIKKDISSAKTSSSQKTVPQIKKGKSAQKVVEEAKESLRDRMVKRLQAARFR